MNAESLARVLTPLRRGIGSFGGRWSTRDKALLCLCPVLMLLAALGSERWRLRDHALIGVHVDGKAVAGWSQAALREDFDLRNDRLQRLRLNVVVGSTTFRLGGAELGAELDAEPVIDRALAAGRSGNPLEQLIWRAQRWSSGEHFESELQLDLAEWDRRLSLFEQVALPTPSEGRIWFSGGKLRRQNPQPGRAISRTEALAALRTTMSTVAHAPDAPEAPVEVRLPLTDIEARTTEQAVTRVFALAERVLSGPVSLVLDIPERLLPEVSERDGSAGPKEDEKPPASTADGPVIKLGAASLGPAIQAHPDPKDPSSLTLGLDPEVLDQLLEPARQRWERPAQDAVFQVSRWHTITIEPSHIESHLPTTAVQNAVLEASQTDARRAVVSIVEGKQPRITTEIAKALNIRSLVSEFTTSHPCCAVRVKNIHRMADLVDGTVVLPGETFSINELVGPRTAANGFFDAPTIVRGEMEDTVGGGVSQFATTIFNAVLNAGYEVIERQAHSYYFPRYPLGHEATLSYPKPDFIFRNDTASGVLIKTLYGETYIRVRLYGDNEGRKVKRIVSQRFDFVEPKIEYEADPTLSPTEEKVVDRGSRGFSVDVSRKLTLKSGEVRTESRKVIYNPRTRLLRVHPCMIPEGEPGHTGEECPEPELDAGAGSADAG